MYRTGKSYILNMLMGRPAGFEVGPTVRACTKGIWLWGGVVRAKDMPQGDAIASSISKSTASSGTDADDGDSDETIDLLFMDTEGLGSTSRSETYDSRVFALALLLSSYFVYNSVGTIDGGAISKLSLVVNLTKHIHVRAHSKDADSGSEYGQFFPQFLWVVRDFGVRLEKDGRRISARDYLEDALKPESAMGDAADAKNAVRLLLRSFFPERDCLTMVRPVTDESKLAMLAAEPWDGLRPEFRSQVDALRRRVFGGARPKTLFGQPLTGSMLVELARAYTEAINENKAPTISTAWERVVESRCAEAVDAAMAVFESTVQAACAVRAAREEADAAERAEALAAAARQEAAAASGSAPLDGAADAVGRMGAALAAARAEPASAGRSAAGGAAGGVAAVLSTDGLLAAVDEAAAGALALFSRDAVTDDARAEAHAARLRGLISERRAALMAQNDASSAKACQAVARAAWTVTEAVVPPLRAGEGGGAGPLTAAMVAATLQRRTAVFEAAYSGRAAGPAASRVLAEWLAARPAAAGIRDADACDASTRGAVSLALEEAESLRRGKVEAEGRLRVAEETRVAERTRLQGLLDAAARDAATKQEALRAQLEARAEELSRAEARATREREEAREVLEAARGEAEAARGDAREAVGALVAAQEGMLARLEAKVDMAAELAAARARLLELEAEAGLARLRAVEAEKNLEVVAERLTGAAASTEALEREAELLRESLEVKQRLVEARDAEKEELEYQWGVTKAAMASMESEKLQLQSDVNVWKSLCSTMKVTLGRAGKSLKGLDAVERSFFDSI